jgi:hypothetical protein
LAILKTGNDVVELATVAGVSPVIKLFKTVVFGYLSQTWSIDHNFMTPSR